LGKSFQLDHASVLLDYILFNTSRTVSKSNNDKQKNTTLPEQSQNPIMKNKKIPHFQNSLKIQFVLFISSFSTNDII
jgi:hypothetical protein